jgi:PAS domain S-box-containing protein
MVKAKDANKGLVMEQLNHNTEYQAIAKTTLDGMIVIDELSKIRSFNPAAERIFGYDPYEVIDCDVKILLHQSYHDSFDRQFQDFHRTGAIKIIGATREVEGIRKDGLPISLDLEIVDWNSNGRRFLTGIVRDTIERKLAEESSRAAESRYRAIVDTAVDAIAVIDEQGMVQSFNLSAERIFGFRTEEVVGQNIRMLMPEPDKSSHDSYLSNYQRTRVPKIIGVGRSVEGCKKDGSLFPLELSIAKWSSGGKHFFTGIMRDLTERNLVEQEMHRAKEELERLNRHLEERVLAEVVEREAAQMRALRAERIQALGQLAGGIAHDFNNVLQAVSGAADLLRNKNLQTEHLGRIADTVARATQRGSLVTERLLAFARRSPLKPDLIDVAATLNDIGGLLAQTLGSSITVRVDVEAALEPLMVDGGQLETVLINIATNARDAMPAGGVFTLSAKRLLVTGRECDLNGLSPGRYISIAGSDVGLGMDEASVIRATEPFYTTKPQGKGTGLGLSMAKGFAEQSGGGLLIESAPGVGTTVSIYLPELNRTSDRPHHTDRTQPRILVVDDDEMIRDMLELQLINAGYTISIAGDGAEAVASFAANGADLVLADYSMPGMNGVKLIEALQERRPDLPAILLTGYTSEQVAWHGDSPFRLLHKPVSQARLVQEITSCLTAGSPG